jgi:orotidine-5'-phosphate decarboxylase
MQFTQLLRQAQTRNNSLLCVGLDPDPARLPTRFANNPRKLGEFCKAIVDATADIACAFKPQIAYFAAHRAEEQLEDLIQHIHHHAPGVPVVLDAKRGDIGSTAEQYAAEAFVRYEADALTLSPFMGFDSIEPYLKYTEKGLFILCRTSNPGGSDVQALDVNSANGAVKLFEHIAALVAGPWNTSGQLGMVVGATFPSEVARVRAIAPNAPLLIPGIGAQGGDLLATVRAGKDSQQQGMLINSSRAILYASQAADFADAARAVALATRADINAALL